MVDRPPPERVRRMAAAARKAAARRQAARESRERDVAQRVYNIARELVQDRSTPLPLELEAPLTAAAEYAAPRVAERHPGLDEADEQVVADVAAYMISGFVSMMVELDLEHFMAWRRNADAAEGGSLPGMPSGVDPADAAG